MSDNYRFKENIEERIVERVNRKKQKFMQINKKSAALRRMMLLLPILLAVAVPESTWGQSCASGQTMYRVGSSDPDCSKDYGPLRVNYYNGYYQTIYPNGSMCKANIKAISFYYSSSNGAG